MSALTIETPLTQWLWPKTRVLWMMLLLDPRDLLATRSSASMWNVPPMCVDVVWIVLFGPSTGGCGLCLAADLPPMPESHATDDALVVSSTSFVGAELAMPILELPALGEELATWFRGAGRGVTWLRRGSGASGLL